MAIDKLKRSTSDSEEVVDDPKKDESKDEEESTPRRRSVRRTTTKKTATKKTVTKKATTKRKPTTPKPEKEEAQPEEKKDSKPEKKAKAMPEPPNPPKWKMKEKVGPHRLSDGTRIYPGDTINVWPEEIEGAIDKFQCLTPGGESTSAPPPVSTLTVLQREDKKYDVIGSNGKPINTVGLSKKEADSLKNGV